MRINTRYFIAYKFFNNLFAGLSLGAIFIIYAELAPNIFSIGGFVLSIVSLGIALLYSKIINIKAFFAVTVFIELLALFTVIYYLFRQSNAAIIIYICYQIMFVFGSYSLRTETIFLQPIRTLSALDASKQIGYIAGLAASSLFYSLFDVSKQTQIYYMHFALLVVQVIAIYCVFCAFGKERKLFAELPDRH
ncbi:hypothetical protein FACS1894103_0110 [Campylobacterota bacterium]|nr:hypothetical protein FACS1894103_0110 [Campylobacterota bacterium]